MIQFIDTKKENLIAARLSGKLNEKNLKTVHDRIHQIIDKGHKVDFYFEMDDFEGYTLKGFWEDIKTDAAHIDDYGKMAFVGDKKWQEWAASATDFFTGSDAKYFELENKAQAMAWMAS
ncbi:STAS/SEC14 domain-containing protein [Euzebyella marina]|uniref:STAS/SEC14 domain-containing protein n=1 Tax=Euzebyella marina TaxID=1761453 RepID=A0A3G2L4K7_9FLAO|nr:MULTISPECIES: STAS/SEC14 domain-containing protein [Bacteroidota]AYN67200.1 STAS/SEC14 domain-containing protein [Euzebyella marina]MBC6999606.1 STAS/SEC14 domain-containing protein [Cytophaga sp. FL35]